ncbi:neurocan core protein-like [Montipora foliosa]|uniref:neurocan core protein-like n=1 Tax=Montipora foliosa TaxID=591990 RepID=UPI0035F18661
MECYPKVLLLVFLSLLVYLSRETRGNKAIRRGGPSGIDHVNFKEEKFSYLNVTALSKIVVKQSSLCAFACLETLSCFSFNVAAFLDNGELLCELLASEKYNNRDKFIPSNSFHHFSIASPCSSWPCDNNGTCMTEHKDDSYNCVCREGFTGKNCENYACPTGFVKHGKLCYYINNTVAVNQTDAQRICQNLGADLAVIKSPDENDFIYQLVEKANSSLQGPWIGLHRKADTEFYWLDDTPSNKSYEKWNDNEPNNAKGDEDCVLMLNSEPGSWNDQSCSFAAMLLCQKSI